MKTNTDLILMVLSGATMVIFTLAIVGVAVIGKTIFGA
jgi:hypothetical protein